MKTFYVISVLAVILLFLSPMVLLPRSEAPEGMVAYSTYGSKIRSLDPATCGDTTSAGVQGNIYESLYAYHYLKRPIEISAQLAEGMPVVSPDGLTYTIKLKRGVKYHRNECFGRNRDGTPKTRAVKADDFVLAFKRIVDYHIDTSLSLAFIEDKLAGVQTYRIKTQPYDQGDFSRYDLPFEGVQAVDDQTLRFKLTSPFPQLLYVLAINCYAPIPREAIDYYLASTDGPGGQRRPIPMRERTAQITDYRAVVGTGAYYLRKYLDGGDIILARNPDFRAEYYPREGEPASTDYAGDQAAGLLKDAGQRVPLIDVNVMLYVPEDNPAWKLFEKRQVDMSGIPRELYNQVISPDKNLTDQWAKQGIRLIKYSDPAVYWYVFNMEDKVVGKSKALRQAMGLAFNVEDYIDVIFNGRAIRALTYVPSSFEAYQEAGPSPYARFDLAAARARMVQARQELEAAGVMPPGAPFPELRLDFGGQDESQRRVGEFAMQQFKQIGLTIKIELNDWPTLQKKVENKQTQIYAMGWHADYPDPENFLQLYYSPNIDRGTNNSNYSDPQFDKLYEKSSVMMPGEARRALYVQALRKLNEDCPVLLLTEPISFVLAQAWVTNVKYHPIGYGMFKYRNLDVEMRRQMGGR